MTSKTKKKVTWDEDYFCDGGKMREELLPLHWEWIYSKGITPF